MDPAAQVTRLLLDLKNGDPAAVESLDPIVYNGLCRFAAHFLRDELSYETFQHNAQVHEAYLRLVAQAMPDWESRSHFFGVAAHLMRQILVDHARRHRSQKRGGGRAPASLDEIVAVVPMKSDDIVALDDALNALADVDVRKSKVIELRFFGGLSFEETARALDVSVGTIGRDQRLAEAWLHRELSRGDP